MGLGAGTAGPPPLLVTVNTVSLVPVPQVGGHSMSDIPSTYPVELGSVWMAGVGVKAWLPSSLVRPTMLPEGNELAAGQLVMGTWPCGLGIHNTSEEVDSWLLEVG